MYKNPILFAAIIFSTFKLNYAALSVAGNLEYVYFCSVEFDDAKKNIKSIQAREDFSNSNFAVFRDGTVMEIVDGKQHPNRNFIYLKKYKTIVLRTDYERFEYCKFFARNPQDAYTFYLNLKKSFTSVTDSINDDVLNGWDNEMEEKLNNLPKSKDGPNGFEIIGIAVVSITIAAGTVGAYNLCHWIYNTYLKKNIQNRKNKLSQKPPSSEKSPEKGR